MKKIILFIACIFWLLLPTCRKDSPAPHPIDPEPIDTIQPIIELGKVFVKKDGLIWSRPFSAKQYQEDEELVFGISSKVKDGDVDEEFSIGDIPCAEGYYIMERGINSTWGNGKPQASLSWRAFDQVLGGIRVDTTYTDNFVQVIRYDSTERIAEGRFQMHLCSNQPNSWGFPDSMYLTEGKFHLRLEQ